MTRKELQDDGADLVSEIDSLIEDVGLLNLKVSQERCREAVDRLFSGHELFGMYFNQKEHSPHPEQGACQTIPREGLFWSTGCRHCNLEGDWELHDTIYLTSWDPDRTANNHNVLVWSAMLGIVHPVSVALRFNAIGGQ